MSVEARRNMGKNMVNEATKDQAQGDQSLLKEITNRGVAVRKVRFFIYNVDKRHVPAVLEAIMADNRFIEDCDHRQNGMLLENVFKQDDTYGLRFIKPSSPQTAEEDLRRARELFIPILARFSGDYDGSEFAGESAKRAAVA
jgi:hypothetical protein